MMPRSDLAPLLPEARGLKVGFQGVGVAKIVWLADYSHVDMLSVRYESVIFGAENSPA